MCSEYSQYKFTVRNCSSACVAIKTGTKKHTQYFWKLAETSSHALRYTNILEIRLKKRERKKTQLFFFLCVLLTVGRLKNRLF